MERYRQMRNSEKIRASQLRLAGNSYASIAEFLHNEAEDGRKFDRATVYRVCRDMRKFESDGPFEWHRLGDYEGLSLESARYILDMWRDITELEASLTESHWLTPHVHTVRQVKWWWKVHLAVPDMKENLNVYLWAQEFHKVELYRDLFGQPGDFAGLEAYLAYQPWVDGEHERIYLDALSAGRISDVPDRSSDYLFDIRGEPPRNLTISLYAGQLPGYIDILNPSRLPVENMKYMLNATGEYMRRINGTLEAGS